MIKGHRNRSDSWSSVSTTSSTSTDGSLSDGSGSTRRRKAPSQRREENSYKARPPGDAVASAVDKDPEIRRIRAAMKLARARQQVLRRDIMTSREDSEVPVQLRSKAVNGEDDLMDEVVQLKIKLSAREDEMKYLERRLSEKEDIIRDMGSKHTLTHKAAISSLWDSLKSLETKVTDNSTNITSVCSRLERITAGLERHSMQGHHLVGSRSAVGLFLKLREGINEIRTLVGTTSKASHRSGENESAALPSSSPSLAAATDHHKADAAFLDLCRYLEDENLRLQQSHVALQRELDALRADAEVAALIPQYRMVIVRARAQLDQLNEQLEDEQKINQSLKHQLEIAHDELERQCSGGASREVSGRSNRISNDYDMRRSSKEGGNSDVHKGVGWREKAWDLGSHYDDEFDSSRPRGGRGRHDARASVSSTEHHDESVSASRRGRLRREYRESGAEVRRKQSPDSDRSIGGDDLEGGIGGEDFDFNSALRDRQRREDRKCHSRSPPHSAVASKGDRRPDADRWTETFIGDNGARRAPSESNGAGRVTSRSKTSSTNRQSSDNINNSRRAPVEASRDRDAKEAAEETDRDVGSVTLEIQDREREVEMELLALDDEIALLKRKLEQAAMAHTQQIVADVIKSV